MKKEYLTIDEVMSLLDLRRRDVERMVRQGLMPHTQLTKNIVRFNTLDLTEWLKQRSISSQRNLNCSRKLFSMGNHGNSLFSKLQSTINKSSTAAYSLVYNHIETFSLFKLIRLS